MSHRGFFQPVSDFPTRKARKMGGSCDLLKSDEKMEGGGVTFCCLTDEVSVVI